MASAGKAHAHGLGNQFGRSEGAVGAVGVAVEVDHLVTEHSSRRFEFAPDFREAFIDRLAVRMNHDGGIERRLVGIRNAGEVPDLAGERTLIQALWYRAP